MTSETNMKLHTGIMVMVTHNVWCWAFLLILDKSGKRPPPSSSGRVMYTLCRSVRSSVPYELVTEKNGRSENLKFKFI